MEIRIPEVIAGKNATCQLRGLTKAPGEAIEKGDYLGELRIEYQEESFSDCPVLYYGDLIAAAAGTLQEWRLDKELRQGDVVAIVSGEGDEFPVEFLAM
jgi:hypothetical protein